MREREELLEDKYVKEKNKLGPISEVKRASICKPRLLALAGQQKRQETKKPGNKKYRQPYCQATLPGKKTGNKKARQPKRQDTLMPGNKKEKQHGKQITRFN